MQALLSGQAAHDPACAGRPSMWCPWARRSWQPGRPHGWLGAKGEGQVGLVAAVRCVVLAADALAAMVAVLNTTGCMCCLVRCAPQHGAARL